jgi:4-amino-4-deoxy-L-arabinose transferase-like glycosyltransferase
MAQPSHDTRLPPLAWAALTAGALALALAHARMSVVAPDAARFSFDSAEYALAGRAWLETGRLVTPFVHPAALGSSPGPPYPLLVGHPLVPALDAVAFAIFGTDPLATLAPAMLAFVLTVLVTTRLAHALSGSRAAGIAAGAAFALSPWALRFASEGLSEMPFAACLTAAFLLLWQLPERPRPLLLGLALGIAHLTRPVVVPLLPAFALGLLLLAPRRRRLAVTLLTLAGFLPVALLTGLYRWLATGSPASDVGSYLLLTGVTPEYAVARLNRMTPPPDALAWIRAHPAAWAGKVVRNLRSVGYGAWRLGGRWPGALAVLAGIAALASGDRRARAFVLVLALAAVLLALLASATVADPRMLFPLLPAGVALALAGVARAAEVSGGGRRVVVAVAAALVVLAGVVPLASDWSASLAGSLAGRSEFHESEWRGLGLGVQPMLPEGVLVASDAAPWIAWYARHPVTLVPLEPAGLVNGPARLRPGAVVLTNEWLLGRPDEGAWNALLRHREAPPGFRLAGFVRSGRLEGTVFTRIAPHP